MTPKEIAERASKASAKHRKNGSGGLNPDLLLAQMGQESGPNFNSRLAIEDHNYAGLTRKGNYVGYAQPEAPNSGLSYMTFSSDEAFADYYGYYLSLYENDGIGIYNANTIEEYATVLCTGGYFPPAYLSGYIAGMHSRATTYGLEIVKLSKDYDPNKYTHSPGISPNKAKDSAILDFTRLKSSIDFITNMSNGLSAGEYTLHQYLTQQLNTVYHELFYIPTGYKGANIIAKPELLFILAPSCNIIYPHMKSALSFTREYKAEPTRIVINSPPGKYMIGANSTFGAYSSAYIDEKIVSKPNENDMGIPMYKKSFISTDQEHYNPYKPMTDNVSRYEYRNGINAVHVSGGSDLAIFMISSTADTESGESVKAATSYVSEKDSLEGMTTYAKYELARQMYRTRTGSVTMCFNPYIVPGFPMISVEGKKNQLSVYGYVTSVAHDLSERSMSTTVSFNCARMDNDAPPEIVPVIENDYAGTKLIDTYQSMLGPTVTAVGTVDIEGYQTGYCNEDTSIASCLGNIWRELWSVEDYCEHVADGASISYDTKSNIMILKNNKDITEDEDKFFDPYLQARILQYSTQVMADGRAFHINEVN